MKISIITAFPELMRSYLAASVLGRGIAAGKLDTTPLITHTVPLRDIAAAYDLFEHRRDGVIKVAVDCSMA